MRKLKTIKNKSIYDIKKKICDILYKRVTYIPEKGLWVSTVIFPKDLVFSDGDNVDVICGVTEVFKGNKDKVEYSEQVRTTYINKRSDASAVHRSVVEEMKTGYIAILG